MLSIGIEILDGNSQVCFDKAVLVKIVTKANHAERHARSAA
jgi:hypothetical protein